MLDPRNLSSKQRIAAWHLSRVILALFVLLVIYAVVGVVLTIVHGGGHWAATLRYVAIGVGASAGAIVVVLRVP